VPIAALSLRQRGCSFASQWEVQNVSPPSLTGKAITPGLQLLCRRVLPAVFSCRTTHKATPSGIQIPLHETPAACHDEIKVSPGVLGAGQGGIPGGWARHSAWPKRPRKPLGTPGHPPSSLHLQGRPWGQTGRSLRTRQPEVGRQNPPERGGRWGRLRGVRRRDPQRDPGTPQSC